MGGRGRWACGTGRAAIGSWSVPVVPPGAKYAEVLGLAHDGVEVAALIALSGQRGTSLLAAWTGAGRTWTTSSVLPLSAGARLVSFGAAPAGGLFALVKQETGTDSLEIVDPDGANVGGAVAAGGRAGSGGAGGGGAGGGGAGGGGGGGWRRLSAPAGTGTVAFGPGATIDALAVQGTIMTVWELGAGSTAWSKRQVVHVALVYGSSG